MNSPVTQKFIELDKAICELYATRLEREERLKGQQDSETNMITLLMQER